MSSATVTPGYVFANNELVTYTKLNQLGNPGVSLTLTGSQNPQNYLRNGNFYSEYWATTSGVTCPTGVETGNAAFWTVNPSGASVTYSESTTVPPTGGSSFSAQITGNTSTTTVNLSQTILGDLSCSLNNTVSFSCRIYNNSGINLTPTLIVYSANSFNNFTAVTQIASATLQTIVSTQWGYETATINLTGLTNVNNGLKVTIQFPSGSLASGTQTVNVCQAVLVIGSTAITFVDDFPLIPPASSYLYRQSAGNPPFYNSIINGDMQINARNSSGITSVGSGSAVYTLDKWKANCSIGTVTGRVNFTQNALALTQLSSGFNILYPDTKNSLRMTVGTTQATITAGQAAIVYQVIERQMARPLFDGVHSLSLVLQSSITGTFCAFIANNPTGTPTQTYVMECPIATANTPTRFTFQGLPALTTGTGTWGTNDTDACYMVGVCLAAGSTFQTTAGAWQTGNFYADSNQSNLFGTNGATLDITLVQHESGPICTPFYSYSSDIQAMRCKRYFNTAGGFLGLSANTTDTYNMGVFYFENAFRTSPSLVAVNGTSATFTVGSGSAGTVAMPNTNRNSVRFNNSAANWSSNVTVSIANAGIDCDF